MSKSKTIRGTIDGGRSIIATVQQDMTQVNFAGRTVRGRHARMADVARAFREQDLSHPDVDGYKGLVAFIRLLFGAPVRPSAAASITTFFNRVRAAQYDRRLDNFLAAD